MTQQHTQQNQPDVAALFAAMHKASRREPPADLQTRLAHLRTLRQALDTHGKALVGAVFRDFGGRSPRETLFAELIPTGGALAHASRHLPRWMRPERRRPNWTFLPSRARVHYQPKGVVLIIAPWNYPILLAIEPLIGALAAGNRVLLKPSERTPATAKALEAMIAQHFAPDHVQVIRGGPDIARRLTALPFDHILFTGSADVGRQVMKAAAEHLTPLTLELGGKTPALVHSSFDLATACERIAFGKLLNGGQTCIAPDYALLHRSQVDAFVQSYQEVVKRFYPKLVGNADYTPLIDSRHYERLQALLDDARQKGAEILSIDPAGEMPADRRRKLAPTLVLGARDDMQLLSEEIFGPVLPVLSHDSLEDAIALINARPRPLALYYFDNDRRRVDKVLRETVSGGVSVNDTLAHFVQHSLPFGGIGASGMGAYHGRESFLTFSHAKAVYQQSRLRGMDLLMPPWGPRFDRIIKALMGKF